MSSVCVNFMNNLKKIKEQKNLTNKDIGELLNVTTEEARRKVQGINQLTEEQIKILCKALKVRADVLLGLEEEEKKD